MNSFAERPRAPGERPPFLYVCADPGISLFGSKGSSTHVREMARALAALGERVVVASAGALDSEAKSDNLAQTGKSAPLAPCRAEACGFEILHMGGERTAARQWMDRRMGMDLRLAYGAWRARRQLDAWIRAHRPWAVYERLALYGAPGLDLALRRGFPCALEANAFLSEESRSRLHFPRLAARIERRTLRRAPAIAAISIVMKQWIAERCGVDPARILVSPMGIDPSRFHPDASPDAARRRMGELGIAAPPSGFLLGYVGSFNWYHRPEWLLDLAEGLRKRAIPFVLLVIGGDAAKVERQREEAGRRGIADSMRFLGQVEHDALPSWFAAMDLAVVPGAAPQSSPTKIVEAAAVGVPQIMPDLPAVRYLAGRLGGDFFFPSEQIEALIEATVRALGALEDRKRRAREHAAEFVREHSWQSRAAEILDALRRQGNGTPLQSNDSPPKTRK